MKTRKLFQALVFILSIGLFLIAVFIIGQPFVRLLVGGREPGTGGIGVAAGGVSWSFLKALVLAAIGLFLVVAGLLWARLARR